MLSIDNNTLAVGTVASGAAATNVIYQHRNGINNHIRKPVWKFVTSPFKGDTYTKIGEAGNKLKTSLKNDKFGTTLHKVGHKVKEEVRKEASSVWNVAKKGWASLTQRTDWGKVAKVSGYAAIAAAGALVAKALWDANDYNKYKG